ncbi:MAG: hypothetical protein FWF66_06950 [Candidatus Bathyarchaeota archaeon]|nr:hypothetical protein [Candidatus Termiticorpusculum sp.]
MLQLLVLWLPFVFALSVLVYACVFDFKDRQVSNKVWLLAYPVGIMLVLVQVGFSLLDGGVVLVSVLVGVFLGVVLFWSGYFGGADLKALLFIALTVPMIPAVFNPFPNFLSLPLILVVFCNSVLLSLVWPLTIFVLNLKDFLFKRPSLFEGINLTIRQKVWLLFTARLVSLDKLGGLRYFPSETVVFQEGRPTRKLLCFVKAEADLTKYVNVLKENKQIFPNGVFVSFTIPFIVFFTFALVTVPIGAIVLGMVTLF